MAQSVHLVGLSRAVVAFLIAVVWYLLYLDAKFAYSLPKGKRKSATQLSLVLAAAAIFIFQVNLMNRFAPADAQGGRFFLFILIECGGGIGVILLTLIRQKQGRINLQSKI